MGQMALLRPFGWLINAATPQGHSKKRTRLQGLFARKSVPCLFPHPSIPPFPCPHHPSLSLPPPSQFFPPTAIIILWMNPLADLLLPPPFIYSFLFAIFPSSTCSDAKKDFRAFPPSFSLPKINSINSPPPFPPQSSIFILAHPLAFIPHNFASSQMTGPIREDGWVGGGNIPSPPLPHSIHCCAFCADRPLHLVLVPSPSPHGPILPN